MHVCIFCLTKPSPNAVTVQKCSNVRFFLISINPVNLHIQSEYGKIGTRKSSVFGHSIFGHVSSSECYKTTCPASIYLVSINNRNTTRCEICSKLTIKIPERSQWYSSGVFIVNFEHISHFVPVFLLLTLNM